MAETLRAGSEPQDPAFEILLKNIVRRSRNGNDLFEQMEKLLSDHPRALENMLASVENISTSEHPEYLI